MKDSMSPYAVRKGGVPPLKIHLHSTLNQLHLERGQATLPHCNLFILSCCDEVERLMLCTLRCSNPLD